MQRIFDVHKWRTLAEGQAVEFRGDTPRVVRLDVNAPGPANLYVLSSPADEDGELVESTKFLAHVHGRDVIEFFVPGKFALVVDGGSCSWYSVDGDDPSFVDPSPEVFTRIHDRRPRNHELEYIAAVMQRNIERRLESQAHELRAEYDRRERERAERSEAEAAAAAGDDPEEPATADPDPAPAAPAARPRGRGKDTGRRDDEE